MVKNFTPQHAVNEQSCWEGGSSYSSTLSLTLALDWAGG